MPRPMYIIIAAPSERVTVHNTARGASERLDGLRDAGRATRVRVLKADCDAETARDVTVHSVYLAADSEPSRPIQEVDPELERLLAEAEEVEEIERRERERGTIPTTNPNTLDYFHRLTRDLGDLQTEVDELKWQLQWWELLYGKGIKAPTKAQAMQLWEALDRESPSQGG